MEITPYVLMIAAFAGVIHGGFSLGTSMLTLLSGHSLSRRRSHARVLRLTGGFVVGSFCMILLMTLALTFTGMLVFALGRPIVPLLLGTGTVLTGLWVTFFYFRRGRDGTSLWLPRSFARYLNERTLHTKSAAEAFVLGGASVIYELPVTIWLIATCALFVPYVTVTIQIPVIIFYSLLAVASLVIVFCLIGGGHTGASITRFRARHKRFIQALVGLSMITLGAAVFWNQYYAVASDSGVMPW